MQVNATFTLIDCPDMFQILEYPVGVIVHMHPNKVTGHLVSFNATFTKIDNKTDLYSMEAYTEDPWLSTDMRILTTKDQVKKNIFDAIQVALSVRYNRRCIIDGKEAEVILSDEDLNILAEDTYNSDDLEGYDEYLARIMDDYYRYRDLSSILD